MLGKCGEGKDSGQVESCLGFSGVVLLKRARGVVSGWMSGAGVMWGRGGRSP